jgi:rhamnose transport system substrate-binding protein
MNCIGSQQDLGYLTYYAAQVYAQGKATEKKDETFSAGRLGEYTFGDDGEVVLGSAVRL